jgi:hypothetical protein
MPPPILEGCPLESTLNGLRPISDHGTMPPGGIVPGIHMDRHVGEGHLHIFQMEHGGTGVAGMCTRRIPGRIKVCRKCIL